MVLLNSMTGKSKKLLSLLVKQYEDRHQRLPAEIVVHPVALAGLVLKSSVAPVWMGIPVKCEDVNPEAKGDGSKLGVGVVDGNIQGFDL